VKASEVIVAFGKGELRMKKVFPILAVFLCSGFAEGRLQTLTEDRAGTEKVGREFNILEYGAVEGGEALCTEAIRKAIDVCADAGGGRVVVPAGTFLTGTVFMKSNMDLHLEKDAVLLGSPWMHDYPPQKPTTRRRYDWHLRTSLIFAQGARGISVTGEGTLNGNSKSENDFIEKGGRSKYRPVLIWFDECTNVTVRDVTFTSSGFWTQAYTKCRNVHVDGITVKDSTFRNNDGCNIIDCENAVVENCDIDALDDGICLKAYTPQGCKNVVIRNNRVRSLCNGIKAGTDSSGGFQNILIENNEVYQTGISGIALEIVDGGLMRNVVVRNIQMDVVGTPIFIKLGDRNRPVYIDGVETKTSIGAIRDVHISGIRATVDKVEKHNEQERQIHNYRPYASSITGIPGHYVERIYIDDVDIEILGGLDVRTAEDAKRQVPENSSKYPENRMFGTLPAYGFYIRHAKGVEVTNVRVAVRQQDGRPAFVLDDVHNSVFRDIQTQSVSETSTFSTQPNCTGLELDRQ
jgi:polygalacturonase